MHAPVVHTYAGLAQTGTHSLDDGWTTEQSIHNDVQQVLADERVRVRSRVTVLHGVGVMRDDDGDAEEPAQHVEPDVHGRPWFEEVDDVRAEAKQDPRQQHRVGEAKGRLRASCGEQVRHAGARGTSNLVLVLGFECGRAGDDVQWVTFLLQPNCNASVERRNAVDAGVGSVGRHDDPWLLAGGERMTLPEGEAERPKDGKQQQPAKGHKTEHAPGESERRDGGDGGTKLRRHGLPTFCDVSTVGMGIEKQQRQVHGDDVAANDVERQRRREVRRSDPHVDKRGPSRGLAHGVTYVQPNKRIEAAQQKEGRREQRHRVDDLNIVELLHLGEHVRRLLTRRSFRPRRRELDAQPGHGGLTITCHRNQPNDPPMLPTHAACPSVHSTCEQRQTTEGQTIYTTFDALTDRHTQQRTTNKEHHNENDKSPLADE